MSAPIMIQRSIIVSAPRERVWNAITLPENLSRWIAPQDVRFDRLEVGARMIFTYEGMTDYGSITLVEPQERFVYRWRAQKGYDVMSLVTFILSEERQGIRLTVKEEGFEGLPPEARQRHLHLNGQGWQIGMERMGDDLGLIAAPSQDAHQ